MGGLYGRQANRYSTDTIRKITAKLKYGAANEVWEPTAVDYSTTGIQLTDEPIPDVKKGAMLVINVWMGDEMSQVAVEGQVVWVKTDGDVMNYGVEFFEESADLPRPSS